MRRTRRSLAAPAAGLALGLLLPVASKAQGHKPDFSGSYGFVQKRSDDLREAVSRSVGPQFTQGSKKSEQVRVWIRSWLEGLRDDPDRRILTIEHTPTEFKSGTGDEVNIYYFGREATSMGPGGGNLKVTVAWKDDQIVTEEREAKGKGRITAVYTLVPDGKTLLVAWRLEHDSLLQPLDVRLAFEKVARQESALTPACAGRPDAAAEGTAPPSLPGRAS
jgi:hypothetical protein